MPFKKKTSQLPAKQDVSLLDEAVQKLSSQNAELRGDSKSTHPKPQLPKKRAQPIHRPGAFDILHPRQKQVMPAVLKTVAAKPVNVSTVPAPVDRPQDNEPGEVVEQNEATETSGELYANNLVKPARVSGYQAHENQQAPTIFDTNEYHTELHGWTNKKDAGPWIWLSAVALVVIVAGSVYYMLNLR